MGRHSHNILRPIYCIVMVTKEHQQINFCTNAVIIEHINICYLIIHNNILTAMHFLPNHEPAGLCNKYQTAGRVSEHPPRGRGF
jgi:hypothetical protein